MVMAMEGSNLEGIVAVGDVGRQCEPQQEKAGEEAHANAAPGGKPASASEVSPQTVLAEANGNGNAHEHTDEPHLGENGHVEVSKDVDLKQTGEYLHLETDMSLAALYRWLLVCAAVFAIIADAVSMAEEKNRICACAPPFNRHQSVN